MGPGLSYVGEVLSMFHDNPIGIGEPSPVLQTSWRIAIDRNSTTVLGG
jgi:hypothetical protein